MLKINENVYDTFFGAGGNNAIVYRNGYILHNLDFQTRLLAQPSLTFSLWLIWQLEE
jgi:hypothetical protein